MSDPRNTPKLAGARPARAPQLLPAMAPESVAQAALPGPWHVREGRGSVDLASREMLVPFATTPEDAHVRAHELLHTRVTPQDLGQRAHDDGRSWTGFQACEDSRLQYLAEAHGIRAMTAAGSITPAHLQRSIERLLAALTRGTGDDLAQPATPEHDAGHRGTGDTSSYPDPRQIAHQLACLHLASINTPLHDLARDAIDHASTTLTGPLARYLKPLIDEAHAELIYSYNNPQATINAARKIDQLLALPDAQGAPRDPTEDRTLNYNPDQIKAGEGDQAGCRADPSMIAVHRPPLARRGKNARQRVSKRTQDSGRLTRPTEALRMDGSGQPFSRTRRAAAGTVVIDVSGSMHIEHDHLARIVEAAPGALILTYNHDTQDDKTLVTIVGERGRIVEPNDLQTGGGNRDDASVLAWAAKHGPKGPRVWVSDGMAGNKSGSISPATVAYTARVAQDLGYTTIPRADQVTE